MYTRPQKRLSWCLYLIKLSILSDSNQWFLVARFIHVMQHQSYSITMWTLINKCNAAISLFAERILIDTCCQRAVIMMSTLSVIVLYSCGIYHLKIAICRGITLLWNLIINFWALSSFNRVSALRLMKGRRNDTGYEHFLVIISWVVINTESLIYIMSVSIEIIGWVRFSYPSLFHNLFL